MVSPILTWWLKNKINVEVTLDRTDHCAKNATPKIVNKEVKKRNNFDWSTPQIIKRKAIITRERIKFKIFLTTLIRDLWYLNFSVAFLMATFEMNLTSIKTTNTIIDSRILNSPTVMDIAIEINSLRS